MTADNREKASTNIHQNRGEKGIRTEQMDEGMKFKRQEKENGKSPKRTKRDSQNLTSGGIFQTLVLFALPYLLSCFMQTFYGMADLYVVGRYNGAETITAVSIGSQVMHMITVILIGLAMGATVKIGRAVGGGDDHTASKAVANTAYLFGGIAIVLTGILLLSTKAITSVMLTPEEAVTETVVYLTICFAGIPFITAYNIISSIFRGAGDSRRPMYFVAIACVLNIALDFLFIGGMQLGAAGAALGTVISQAVSSICALIVMLRHDFGFKIRKETSKPNLMILKEILRVGVPVALQDGFIQISFIVITIIANSRGLICSSSVGIVEKIIGFLFLVPSAMLSAISAITAQNIGAGKPERAKKTLRYGLMISLSFGVVFCLYCQFLPQTLVALFTKDTAIIASGNQYLRSYVLDCIFAGIHFCFSGYFCGMGHASISFVHNIISIILIRIPGAYLASMMFPDNLYPMGLAAPMGSILSAIICIFFFCYLERRKTIK